MEDSKTVEIQLDEVDSPKQEAKETKNVSANDLAYAIDDVPPWYLCIFLGFQVRVVYTVVCTRLWNFMVRQVKFYRLL